MTTPLRTCRDGGRLVAMTGWLPRSPEDWDAGVLWQHVGCNHLVCGQCSQPVRAIARAEVADGHTVTAADLRGVDDVFASGRVIASTLGRLYVCDCSIRQVFAPTPADGGYGVDPRVNEPGPWRCAGHPIPSFPLRLDGVRIARPADADEVVRGHLRGELPVASPFQGTALEAVPEAWLLRALAFTDEADWPLRLGAAVARLSDFDDLRQRTLLRAAAMLPAQTVAREALLERCQTWADAGWKASADAAAQASAVATVDALGALATATGGDEAVRLQAAALAQRAWLEGAPCRLLPHQLVALDADWLLEHAAAAAKNRPDAWHRALALTLPSMDTPATDPQAERWWRAAQSVLATVGESPAALQERLGRRAPPWLSAMDPGAEA